ncbi:hypothetical protein [Sphaerisporangium aureirubrum]|uniref:Uncharacterized protein n=1 Tax=Sphaerisporangium aureirubrum TaxID=1544736 RepID=A0ABW1NCF4_9ACTN
MKGLSELARRLSVVAASATLVLGVVPGGTAHALSAGTLAGLNIVQDDVDAGTPADAVVTLDAATTTNTVVALESTDTTVARVPATVTIPAGATSASFTVTTIAFSGPGGFACVLGTVGAVTQADCLAINPLPSGPAITSVTFSPATVQGGGAATGTVRFASATDGAVVSLTSSNPAVANVPATTVVNGGAASGAFPVTTGAVTARTTVTITATANGSTRTGTLTVAPATGPPVSDVVTITRATWKSGLLRIEARSTNPNAILSVYHAGTDVLMFLLTNRGNGRYDDQRGWVTKPTAITVTSNFGGSDTEQVRRV